MSRGSPSRDQERPQSTGRHSESSSHLLFHPTANVCSSMRLSAPLGCLLWCVMVAQCAAFSPNSNDSRVRTFLLFDRLGTDEPIDFSTVLGFEDVKLNASNGSRGLNGGDRGPRISEEALLYLTGPVSTLLIPSFYCLVFLVSVPLNVCAVLAFARGIRPKKPAAIYMLNLAGADLLFALVLPFKIAYHFLGNHWLFGGLMCRVVTAAFYWNMHSSVLLIACISADRLLAVVYPIDSLAWRRPRNALAACAAMWALSLAGSVPLVVSEQTAELPELNVTTCHDVQPWGRAAWLRAYFLTVCCALFFLPLLVTAASYARVVWSLRRVPQGISGGSRKRTRAVVMALTVLVIFVLCFMPTNLLLLTHYLLMDQDLRQSRETPDGSYGLYLMFLCLGSVNCLLDPLVYYFGSSQCQRQLSKLLSWRKAAGMRSIAHSSSDSCRSSRRRILKSRHTESSKLSSSVTKMDSLPDNLSSQYKKLLV
ncbi:proteinase-activated receptor 1-like [Menidia menidia]